MKRTILNYWVQIHDRTWARVYLNDIPVFTSPWMGPDSRSGPINYCLVPGENEVKIELLATREDPKSPYCADAVKFQVYRVDNMDAPQSEKLERTIFADVGYPAIWNQAPEKFQRLPFYHRQLFEHPEDVALPPFVGADTAEFGCDGTPELREAVRHIHRLLETGAYEELLDELALKFAWDERAHEGEDSRKSAVRMQQWREELLRYEPRPAQPLDMALIHFEPRRGGSVAHVTRHDLGHVLDAVCVKDPKRRIRTDLLMVQQGGRWRVWA